MIRKLSSVTAAIFAVAMVQLGNANAQSANEINTSTMKIDFMGAVHLEETGIVVAGHNGLVGTLVLDGEEATLTTFDDVPNEDYTAIQKISASEAFIGASNGKLYKLSGSSVQFVGEVSEYEEPVLDIAHLNGVTWVVGARGMVARSTNSKDFEILEIRDVNMPKVNFPGGQPADWYLGVQNLDTDTLEFKAFVNGKPAISEEHYLLYPDEGFIQVHEQLDMNPPPSVTTRFAPGPPFRGGDVSWNKVLLSEGLITLAGEFGLIIQSKDGGETWVRRNTKIVPREPEPAYWMSGVQNGDNLWLAGAAGVNAFSKDNGKTWRNNAKPGREGIFGVALADDGTPVITGAVGLIGQFKNNDWELADRTELRILSWLKNPVVLPDGGLLVLGGRATAISLKEGQYKKINVRLANGAG